MKPLSISFWIFMISVYFVSFSFIFSYQSNNILYDNQIEATILFNETELDENSLIDEIINFSHHNNVNIVQHTYTDNEEITIFSSNLKKDSYLRINEAEYPIENQYISSEASSNIDQVGTLSMPPSNLKLKIYNFDQVRNVGLTGELLIRTDNEVLLNEFSELIIPYGQVKYDKVSINYSLLINNFHLILVALTLIVFALTFFFYMISERRIVYVSQLWGKSFFGIINEVIRPLRIHGLAVLASSLITYIVFIALAWSQNLFTYYVLSYLVVFIIANGLVYSMVSAITFTFYSLNLSSSSIKGGIPYKLYAGIALFIKFIITVSLLLTNLTSFSNYQELQNQLESRDYWSITQDIYKLNLKIPNYDLPEEHQINNQLSNLYDEIVSTNNAILIDANPYQEVLLNSQGERAYLYEVNFEEEIDQITSPHGRSVTVNRNYLDFNPIYTTEGLSYSTQFDEKPNTLNILVPEQYTKLEEKIYNSFYDYFYFQSVEVKNIYNEASGKDPEVTSKEEFDINIIYVQNNQFYFTFSPILGDSSNQNRIKDPIAMIYSEEMDSSAIAAYMTTSVFIESEATNQAYEEILPTLESTNTKKYVNSVVSVYNEHGKMISELKSELDIQIIVSFLLIILSIAVIILLAWSIYHIKSQEIYLKILFGQYNLLVTIQIIAMFFAINLVCITLINLYMYNVINVYLVILLSVIEVFVLLILTRFLTRKNFSIITKGDYE